jgi:formylglycine-generating enzyme required for sulfatase activity
VVEVIKLRAGLLLERAPEVYTFPHRTFQEYLAGAYLSTLPDFARQATQLVAAGALWRDVILLAVGRLVYLHGEHAKPLELVAELCPAHPTNTDVAWRQAWLAGDVLLEMGLNRVREGTLGRELAERLPERLVELIRGGHLSPVERAAVGNTSARLGDPRFRADAWSLPDEPLLGFVEIPAGPFLMGSRKGDALALESEMPQPTLTLPRFFMGRYPVTVAQFQAFVEASGQRPEREESLHGLSNHPVVNVTWYDARRYCDWLTEQLRAWEDTPEPLGSLLRREGSCVTLPSEAEWEKAARGTDGRMYPWDDELAANRANYDDTGIHATSAVGCFPGGASPYEVEELSGNVSEWTRSVWGTYPYPAGQKGLAERENLDAPNDTDRVWRGGAFYDARRGVRCACHGRCNPDDWDGYLGFRIMVRPCT